MKKKIIVILMAALFTMSFTACGNDNTENTNNSSNVSVENSKNNDDISSKNNDDISSKNNDDISSKNNDDINSKNEEFEGIGNLTQTAYLDIIKSGNFYMSMSMDSKTAQTTMFNDMIVAICDDKLFLEMKIEEQKVKVYYMNNKAYMVDESSKQVLYYDYDKSIDEILGENVLDIDTDEMVLIETGKEKFNGKECDYEKYNEEELGLKEVMYFENGQIVGIVALNEDDSVASTVNISLTKDIPAGIFDLPSEDEYEYKTTKQ